MLLWNTAGEITDATASNVIVEVDGKRITPSVECGLLPGTYRAMLLESGEVAEASVGLAILNRASRMWLVNSVEGMRQARGVKPGAPAAL